MNPAWEETVSWAEIFEHQQQRRALIEEWLDWLALGPGDVVADLGSGLGLTSILAARRVRPGGRVYAVDHWPAALAFLRNRLAAEGLENVDVVQADIGSEELLRAIDLRSVGKVVLAHVLHHTGEPDRIVRQLYRWLAPGTRMVVAEFDPDAPGAIGPKPDERIARETLVGWLERAGFAMVEARAYPEHEQYAFLAERA